MNTPTGMISDISAMAMPADQMQARYSVSSAAANRWSTPPVEAVVT
jgi:hypothetical protein